MEEPEIIKEGNYSPSGHNASSIVSIKGIAPAVMENHGTVTAIKEPKVINPLKDQSDNGWHFEQQVYDAEGIARGIKAGGGSGNIPKVVEPQGLTSKRTEFGNAIHRTYESEELDISKHDTTTMKPRTDGVCNTLTSGQKDNLVATPQFRIRKLTPRECFRLMGVEDNNIDTIQASGISNSQQYKLAGNSIVVDVLFHIFRKMFCEKQNENSQQTLF